MMEAPHLTAIAQNAIFLCEIVFLALIVNIVKRRMYTLLHLSDLHRSKHDPISNDELLSCLITDSERHKTENPQITKPNAIIVSGDIIQGLPLGATDYPAALDIQYDEAIDLLAKLSDAFVEGDRSRVIIVPGNHDVDWNASRSAMEKVDIKDQDIPALLSLAGSPYRWSWKTQELFRISDITKYETRLDSFRKLIEEFYVGTALQYPIDPNLYWNLFALDEGKIVVCAFNSCSNNDCFNYIGSIPYSAIASSHLAMSNVPLPKLKIAIWHHNTSGPPERTDYMDVETISLMIDKGFRLGLHGHHHKSDVLAYNYFISEMLSMALVSAGSLCAGPTDLPTGFRRQYNIIEIADDYRHARIHVREMRGAGVFVPGRLVSIGSSSYMDVKWSGFVASSLVNSGRSDMEVLKVVEEIEKLISADDFDDSVKLIKANESLLGNYGRKLKIEALFKMSAWDKLLILLRNPQNIYELTLYTRAAIQRKEWDIAETILKEELKKERYESGIIQTLLDEVTMAKRILL